MKTKLEYVLAQMSKARNKSYEAYVVNRIWTKIDSDEIKMICQQHISRPEGRALTDIYYPQIGVHIEIDEAHHLNQQEADSQREADIIDATQHEIWRIPIIKDGSVIELKDLNKIVDHYANEVKLRIKTQKANRLFKPWNLEEHHSEYWLNKGLIHISDDCIFHYNHEAVNCFGLNIKKGGQQQGGRRLTKGLYKGTDLWFPKLFKDKHNRWFNKEEGTEIHEMKIVDGSITRHHDFDNIIADPTRQSRIIFAYVKDNLGFTAYRFKGLYKLDVNKSQTKNHLIWKLNDTSVSTYRP
jgi:hypothetical protein